MVARPPWRPPPPNQLSWTLFAGSRSSPEARCLMRQSGRGMERQEVGQSFSSSAFQLAQTSIRRCRRAKSSASRANLSPTWRMREAF
jgi:hypothetical protein